MSNLYAFLHPESPEQEEVVLPRFKDEDGNVVPFIVRPLTTEENDAIIKKCTITKKERQGTSSKLDSSRYQKEIVVAGTMQPDFSDAQLCEAYGVVAPGDLVGKMLYAGEFIRLAETILRLSGLDDESELEEVEEAKN